MRQDKRTGRRRETGDPQPSAPGQVGVPPRGMFLSHGAAGTERAATRPRRAQRAGRDNLNPTTARRSRGTVWLFAEDGRFCRDFVGGRETLTYHPYCNPPWPRTLARGHLFLAGACQPSARPRALQSIHRISQSFSALPATISVGLAGGDVALVERIALGGVDGPLRGGPRRHLAKRRVIGQGGPRARRRGLLPGQGNAGDGRRCRRAAAGCDHEERADRQCQPPPQAPAGSARCLRPHWPSP